MNHLPALTKKDLQIWFDQQEMIHACIAQIHKDLSAYNISLSYSGNTTTAYEELFAQLLPQVDKLLHMPSTFMAILYRIDIDEKIIKTAALENETFSQTFTRLILWRELQKVVTRKILSEE